MAESVAGIDRSEAAAPGGPPPAGPRTVAPLVVGRSAPSCCCRWPAATTARRWSWSPRSPGSSAPAGSTRRADVDNGEPIFLGRGLRRRWSRIWDTEVRHGS
ncbi:hypothetical protein [Micromonospora sp. NPDC049203]|uniref:hypothetical protein n=1 Tax=Micromonospora sp. NPDC049203 TaxID=3364267 RepID=UPI00371A53ED